MASARELEEEVARMEQRLASARAAADGERAAWHKASRTGKRGTKWKSSAPAARDGRKGSESNPWSARSGEQSADDSERELSAMPAYWDALELAQFLQARALSRVAQAVVSEQISGKKLLDTPPGRLRRLLFPSVDAANDKDASWKALLRVCSFLHAQQKKLERVAADAMDSPRSPHAASADATSSKARTKPASSAHHSDALVFPLISPRGIVGSHVANTAATGQQKKPGAFAPLRRPGPPSSTSSSSRPMATCWSCGARFSRAMPPSATTTDRKSKSPSLKALLSARPYCSTDCRNRIERDDMSVRPALSVSLHNGDASSDSVNGNAKPARPLTTAQRPPAVASGGGSGSRPLHLSAAKAAISVVIRSSVRQDSEESSALGQLHVGAAKLVAQPELVPPAHARPPLPSGMMAPPASCHSPTSSRSRTGAGPRSHYGLTTASGTLSTAQRSVASIPWTSQSSVSVSSNKSATAELSLTLSNSLAATAQSRVFQQSRYRLDPEVFQANRVAFSTVFGAFGASSSGVNSPAAFARGNLLRLQEFLSVRGLHRLSLTSHAWLALITQPSALSDALWGVHVLHTWRQSEDDELLLQQIGVLPKPERPRRMLMKLTRQVGRVALENMKVLLSPESWQLAAILTDADVANIQPLSSFLSTLRRQRTSSSEFPSPSSCLKSRQSDGSALTAQPPPPSELFEWITVIYNAAGEIVAVRAQQLLRPLDNKGESVTSVLQGLQRGTLRAIQCRRLRLFSLANRLPFEQWARLPATRVVFDFYWSKVAPSTATATDTPCVPLRLPVWHQKVLARQQTAMQQRLLGKESVQQVMRGLQERNGPPQVLHFLEKFLVACHPQASAVPRSPRGRALEVGVPPGPA